MVRRRITDAGKSALGGDDSTLSGARNWVHLSGGAKLGRFLERTIHSLGNDDPLNFEFKADKDGPYSDLLRQMLDALDGTCLHCDKQLCGARPSDTIWFDQAHRRHVGPYLQQETSSPASSPRMARSAVYLPVPPTRTTAACLSQMTDRAPFGTLLIVAKR